MDRSRADIIILGDFNIDFNNKKLVAISKLDILENKYALTQLMKVPSKQDTCFTTSLTGV